MPKYAKPIDEFYINEKQMVPWNFKKCVFIMNQNNCDHAKILLVDDEGNNIIALNLLLRKFGYKADSANNGESAIDMVYAN